MTIETLVCTARPEYRNIATSMSRENLLGTVECVSEFLADLREHLNAFIPIHRLPPELLALIFAVVTHIPRRHQDIFNFIEVEVEDEDEERWEYTRARLPSSGVVTITHVCKRWRTVALQTPGLWTHITALPGSDQFLAYSERSLSLSLSMSVGADTPHLEETLSSIGARLRRLDVAINSPEEQTGIHPSILRIEAPSVLCATVMFSLEYVAEDSPDVQWVELFGQQDSSLEALALAFTTNWLASNRFNHLTHLLLSCSSSASDSGSQTGLLTLLANAPRLEYLHIIDFWCGGTNGTAVTLDHLRSMVFDRTKWCFVVPFFARLLIPQQLRSPSWTL